MDDIKELEVHTEDGIKKVSTKTTVQELLDITGNWQAACALFELMVVPMEVLEDEDKPNGH